MLYSCQKITVKTNCVKLHYIVIKDRKLSKLLSKKFGTLSADHVNTVFAMLHHTVIRKQKILKLNVKKNSRQSMDSVQLPEDHCEGCFRQAILHCL